jgi:NAD(P)-dependent dehydrogenase (short-subunit alcohol dehydrogenase family)
MEPEGSITAQMGTETLPDNTKGKVMGKLDGKVAVITGGSSGMALAAAKRFVEEGAYVFITGRRQEVLDEAVKLIGRNVTGVRGDAANLDDLDRLFDTVKREKGKIDVLYASAGWGEGALLGEITEQHFDATFGLNTRGTLFTVQKALPLINDRRGRDRSRGGLSQTTRVRTRQAGKAQRGWRAGADTRPHLGPAHLPGFVQEGAVIDVRPCDLAQKYDPKCRLSVRSITSTGRHPFPHRAAGLACHR